VESPGYRITFFSSFLVSKNIPEVPPLFQRISTKLNFSIKKSFSVDFQISTFLFKTGTNGLAYSSEESAVGPHSETNAIFTEELYFMLLVTLALKTG
jgi:hypothetical protein